MFRGYGSPAAPKQYVRSLMLQFELRCPHIETSGKGNKTVVNLPSNPSALDAKWPILMYRKARHRQGPLAAENRVQTAYQAPLCCC